MLAVIAVSALTFSAAPFFKAQGTPVIGAAQDAGEWLTDKNMFTVFGAGHTNLVSTTFGAYMKSQGVTNLGSIGYDIAPSSAEAAEAAASLGSSTRASRSATSTRPSPSGAPMFSLLPWP